VERTLRKHFFSHSIVQIDINFISIRTSKDRFREEECGTIWSDIFDQLKRLRESRIRGLTRDNERYESSHGCHELCTESRLRVFARRRRRRNPRGHERAPRSITMQSLPPTSSDMGGNHVYSYHEVPANKCTNKEWSANREN